MKVGEKGNSLVIVSLVVKTSALQESPKGLLPLVGVVRIPYLGSSSQSSCHFRPTTLPSVKTFPRFVRDHFSGSVVRDSIVFLHNRCLFVMNHIVSMSVGVSSVGENLKKSHQEKQIVGTNHLFGLHRKLFVIHWCSSVFWIGFWDCLFFFGII